MSMTVNNAINTNISINVSKNINIKELDKETSENNIKMMAEEKYSQIPKEIEYDETRKACCFIGVGYGAKDLNSKYGYAEEFHVFGAQYINTLDYNYHHYAGTDFYKTLEIEIDNKAISKMHDKYNEIKQFIENKYTGTEKEDRLNSLDSDFQEIMLKDIVEPTEITVGYVKRTLSLIEFFRRSDVKRGKKVKTGPEEIRAVINHLDSQSKILEEARKKLKDANRKNGAFKYVQELFETLGINMKQIAMETKKLFVKTEKSEDEKEKQIFELSNKRSRILHDHKHYLTDEEKYREVAKKSKKVTGIDQSIEKLINNK